MVFSKINQIQTYKYWVVPFTWSTKANQTHGTRKYSYDFQDKGRKSLTWFSFQYWSKAGNRQNNVNVLNFREYFIFVLNFCTLMLKWSILLCKHYHN